MFERLVSQLLEGYLGRYIDIQKEQLKILLWNEEVLLEKVELRLEAFDYLQLPFSLKQGQVGRLSIKIPWKKLGWDPINISLEDIFVLASQRDDSEWNLDLVERRELAGKKAKLNAVELAKLSKRVSDNRAGHSFISYISAKIIDSIQVTIKNVHIVYVDKHNDLAKFTFGLRFSSLSVVTDSRVKQNYSGASTGKLKGGQVNKIVEISTLGIYCNMYEENPTFSGTNNHTDFQQSYNANSNPEDDDYIIPPFDATVFLMVNKSGKVDGTPQNSITAELTSLVILLKEVQLQQIMSLWYYFSTCALRERYGRYRPCRNTLTMKFDGWQKRWWRYAQESVLADVRQKLKRTSWSYLGQRINHRRRYVNLYKRRLDLLLQEQPVDKEILWELELMEKDCEINDILCYRAIAERETQELKQKTVSPVEISGSYPSQEKQPNDEWQISRPRGWLNWISLGMLGVGGTTESSSFIGVVSDEVIKDICEATEFHSSPSFDENTFAGDKLCLSSLNFNICQITTTISSKKRSIARIVFEGASFETKIYEDSASYSASINMVKIFNPCNDIVIMASEKAIHEESLPTHEQPFIIVQVRVPPTNGDFERSVEVVVQPFKVIYDPCLILDLVDLHYMLDSFQFQHERVLSSLNGLDNRKVRLLSKLEYTSLNSKKTSWDINFEDIIMHLPLDNVNSDIVVLVVKLGALHLKSKTSKEKTVMFDYLASSFTNPKHASTECMDMNFDLGDLYNYFEIILSNIEMNMVVPNLPETVSLVDKFDASITVGSCMFLDEPWLKQLAVHCKAVSLKVHFSALIYAAIIRLSMQLFEMRSAAVNQGMQKLDLYETGKTAHSEVFQHSVSAELGNLTFSVKLDDDAENSSIIAFILGGIDIQFAMHEYLEYLISIKMLKVSTYRLNGESGDHILCLSRNSSALKSMLQCKNGLPSDLCGERIASSEQCFLLQHRAKRNVIKCDEYTLCLDDIDIHVFPKIFGSLKFFFERICMLGVPSSFNSVESSLGPCQETICKESINGIDLHNCVFSDFVDSESTMSTGISLDSFPFLTVQNCFGNFLSGTVLEQNVQCFRENNLKKRAGAVNISMTRGPNNVEALNILATYNNIKSSVFKMNFNGIKVHFHDLSCIIGTVTLPASNLLLSFHKPDCWELLCSAVGVNISSSWSSLNAHECLWGAATLNVSPILNIRIRKNMVEDQYPLTEISFGIQYVCCILPADYLSILIGYFSLPDWKENHNQQSIEILQHENIEDLLCDVIYKFEILDSTLIIPAENIMDYSMQVGLQQLHFSFIPKCDSKDVFKDVPQECIIPAHRVPDMVHLVNVFGKNTSLSLLLIEKDDGQHILKLDNNDTKTIPLISELDAGLWLRIPYEQSSKNYGFPTLVMIKADVCNFIAEDNYFLLGLEATMSVVDQLSSVDTQSQYYRSDVLQFIQLKRILKESTASHDDSKESFMELRFYASALEIKLCHSNVNHHSNFSREVAKANMQISLSASLRNDVPRNMDVDISGLVLYSFQNSVVLAACGDHTSSCLQINYLQSDQGTDEIVLAIPCLDIWLHLSDWEELIVCVKSCGHASSKTDFSSSESSKSYLRVKSKDVSVSFHLPVRMTGKDSGCQDNKAEVSLPNNLPTNMEGKDTKRCMYLVVSLESRDIELIMSSPCLKLKCMIEKTRAVLQITEVQNSISLPFFQTSQVSLGARVTEQQKDSYYIFSEVQVDTLDIGLSHQLINFWNGINFEISDRASSPIPLFHTSLKVSLRKASLLLSDGRWHSSGPILEILMRNIAAKASKMENVFECSILGDLSGSYNNFQKVMWEPFIEPWSFQLKLVRTQDQNVILSGPTVTDIHIQSAAQLSLNLTEPFLEAIFRGIEMIRDACHHGRANNIPDCEEILGRHTTSDISMKRYAPYILQNDTSLPLLFRVFHGPANIDNISTVKIESMVQPGCSVPIYIDENSEEQMSQNRIAHSSENLSHKIASSVVHHMMSIQLDGTSFPSKSMSMDLVGLSYFEVDFSKPKSSDTDDVGKEENFSQVDSDDHFGRDSNKGFFVPVVFEVSMQRYRKLIRLYSTVVLLNETTMPLEIRFDIPFGVSSKILDPIYPGQEFPLPVHLAKSGRMTWRPLGGDYLWSEAHALSNILSHEHKLGFTRSFVCYPSHPSSDPFRCCISIQDYGLPSSCGPRMQKLDTSTKWFIRQVRLTTPLLVKNYLPVAISLMIESCGVMHSILLPELDSASIFHIDSNHDLGLTLHMHGFKPSITKFSRAETFIATSKLNGSIFSLSETLTFYPDTSSNDPICISLDKMVDAYCNAREICLYVPFLIYNCSGLSLAIAHGSQGKQGHTYIFPPSYHFLGQEQLLTTKNGLAIVSDQDTNVSTLNVDNLMNPLSQDPTISIRKNANLHFYRSLNQYSSDISRHSPRQFQIHVSENGEAPFEGPTGRGSTRSQLNLSGIVGSGSDRPDNEYGRKVKAFIYSPIGSSPESELMVRLCAYLPECSMENNQNPAWSSPFYLIPPSGSNTVIIPRPHTTGAFVVSVTSSSLPGELTGRTRAISIQPRYIICNACNKDLCYKQKGSDYFYHLNVGEHSHIHWADTARELLISIRFNELGWQWSGSFLPDRLGDVLVKMRNYVSGAVNMVRVEVQNADVSITDDKIVGRSSGSLGTLLILLSDDNTGFMPYRIDNFSKENLRIFQQKCECSETIVHSYTSCNYVWDEPYYPHRLIVEVPGERVLGSFCLDDVREFVPVLLPSTSEKPERKFFLSIYAEGATKVLSIIDSGYHNVEDIKQTRFLRIRGQRECDQESRFEFTERIIVHASLIGVSLINSSPQELIFACAKGTTIELMQSSDQQKISLEILSLQIDNQLYDTTFPTLLSFEHLYRHSTQPRQNKEADSKKKNENVSPIVSEFSHEPVIHLSAARWRNVDCSLVSFEYIKFRLSPLRIEIEEQILLSLIDYIKNLASRLQSTNMPNQSWVDGGFDECFQLVPTYERRRDMNTVKPCSLKVSQFTDNHKIMESLPSIVPIGAPWQKLFLLARRQKKIYVEAFDLASIKLTISFSSDPWVTKKDDREDAESLIRASSSAFQRGLMALIDIEGVPVYLRELTLMHLMASQESIQDMIVRHYTRQLRNEIYKVFGSAGVFGNPMGFARNVGVGIKDFLSASSKSIVQSPAELVTGVAQGSKSLVSNTVYAISSAATQFSKAAHKGIVAFTFDQQAVRQNGPHFHGKGVLDEFLEGLTGLLQSPIKGAEKHGLPGVFSGIALGTAGLVARPMASILEVTGKTAQSIRNRSSPHQARCLRMRFPRPLARDLPLLPYSWEEAIGTYMLLEADNAKYRNEIFIMCKALKHPGKFVVVTTKLVLVFRSSSLVDFHSPEFCGIANPEWVIEVEIGLETVIHIDREQEIVNIIGSNVVSPSKQNQQKRTSSSRMSQWTSPTTMPICQMSLEFSSMEEAEDTFQVVWSTLQQGKERGWESYVLHRHHQKR